MKLSITIGQEVYFVTIETVSPDEDSGSVCSSLDGSVCSEDGGGSGVVVMGGGMDEGEMEEQDIQFRLSEHIDQLGDKRCVNMAKM